MLRTLKVAHPYTDNRSCFPCKTDTVLPHHTSASVFYNDYTPAWRAPVYALLVVQLHPHTGPQKGLAHMSLGNTEELAEMMGEGAVCYYDA